MPTWLRGTIEHVGDDDATTRTEAEPLPDVDYLVYADDHWVTVGTPRAIRFVREAVNIVHSARTWREFIQRIIDFDWDLAAQTFGGADDTDIADYLEGMGAEMDDEWPGSVGLGSGMDRPWPPFEGFDPGDYPCVPTELWDLYDYGENVFGDALADLPAARLEALLEGLDKLGRTYVLLDSDDLFWNTSSLRISQ